MHIPDILDVKSVITTTVISAGFLAIAAKKSKKTLDNRQIPFMGIMAAFIFAAQMINIPIAVGTSSHLMGGVLAAILLGPWNASIILTTVLGIQALIFQDGGVTALGANILNVAILAPFVGYYIYQGIIKMFVSKLANSLAIFLASLTSLLVAATAASLELAFSGVMALNLVLPTMLFWHTLVGILEGIVTISVISYLAQIRGDLISKTTNMGGKNNA